MRKWAGSVQVTMTVMAGWSGLFPPLFGEKRVLCLTLKAIRLLLTLLFSLPVFFFSFLVREAIGEAPSLSLLNSVKHISPTEQCINPSSNYFIANNGNMCR